MTATSTFSSALAESVAQDVLARFLRYVKIDTQSQDGAETYPSTAKQLDLLRLLVDELKEIGIQDAQLDPHGYVTGTLPASWRETPGAVYSSWRSSGSVLASKIW